MVGEARLAPGLTAIAASGGFAYVGWDEGSPSEGKAGLWVIDASIPSAPAVVGSLAARGRLTDVAVSGEYVFAVEYYSYSVPGEDPIFNRLRVIDMSTPSAPVEVSVTSMSGTVSGLAISGGYAYIVGRQLDWNAGWMAYLRVIDVSTPSAPVLAGQFTWPVDSEWRPDDVSVSDGYAFVASWGSGFRVIDVSTAAGWRRIRPARARRPAPR